MKDYFNIHKWLRRIYGKASFCENDITHLGKFEYSLIHGKKHARNVLNYRKLCIRCHRLYDNFPKRGKDHWMWGRKASSEARMKMSLARKGVRKTLEHRKKIGKANLGNKLTEEHKNKLRIFHLGKKHTIESRKKMSETRTGKKMSKKTKFKMSISAKIRWQKRKILIPTPQVALQRAIN